MFKEIASTIGGDIKVMYKYHCKIIILTLFLLLIIGSCTSCMWHPTKNMEQENFIEMEATAKSRDSEVFTEFLVGVLF